MALDPFTAYIIQAIITLVISVAIGTLNKPKQRDQKNQVHRQGVDHDLERVYGKRRMGIVVTDALTSDQYINPLGLTLPANTIVSNGVLHGRANQTLHGDYVMYYEGPLCVSGRLNAPFQTTLLDANFQVNEKDWDDNTLKSSDRLTTGAAYELNLAGGVRHAISDSVDLGPDTNVFTNQVSASGVFFLNIKKEITYSGIPEATLDLTANDLYWPGAGDTWNTPATWTGRASNPALQALDYLLDEDFGFGVALAEIETSTFDTLAEIGNTPVGTIAEKTSVSAFNYQTWGVPSTSTLVKTFTPAPIFDSNLTLSTADHLNENMEQLLAACRGARLFKNRSGKWAIAPAWLHEDALVQTFTGQAGTGPFDMDYPTAEIIVKKNTVVTGAYTLNLTDTITTVTALGVPGTPTGTDPASTIGISFTTPLIAGDTIEISYLKDGTNTNGIPGQTTALHIVSDPAELGLDYDATLDNDSIRLCRVHDREATSLKLVTLDDRINQCVVKFPDAFTKYKNNQVVWPADGSATHTGFLADDNNKPLIETISINSITDQEKALDFAEFMVRQKRSADNLAYHLDITGLQLEPNDLVKVTDPSMNIDGELWRIGEIAIQPDATVKCKLVRYQTEDFTYVVESYSTSNLDRAYREFGPVTNIGYTPDLTDDLVGPGSLTWDEVDQASSYVVDISKRRVWHGSETWPINKVVYYAGTGEHYKANTAITSGQAAPNINANWDEVNNEDLHWNRIADTATNSAMVPDVRLGRQYAFRIFPKSALRRLGVPAYHETIVDPIQSFVITTFFQNSAPLNQGEFKDDQWFDEDDSDNQYRYDGTTWNDTQDFALAHFFGGAHDAAVRSRGRCHTFWYYSEPTDSDCPNEPADVLGEGDLWFIPYNSLEYYRYDGAAWVRIQITQGNHTFAQDSEPTDADSPIGVLQTNDRWVLASDSTVERIYNGTDWSDQASTSGRVTSQIISGFYVVGDSLTAPNGGDDGAATYDTNGSGDVQNITITAAGTGYGKNFLYLLRDGTARAWIQFNANASGALTTGTVQNQIGAFTASQTGVSVGTGLDSNTIESWAFQLHNESTADLTIDAANGQSVAVSTTNYVYNAPTATFDQQLAIIHLGGNDSGHVNGDGENMSQATFETAYKALIQNFLDDGYKVFCILPSYNNVFTPANITTIREWVGNASVDKGVECWDIPTSNYLDGIHMTHIGHTLWAQIAYQHLAAAAAVNHGDAPWLKSMTFSDGFLLSSFLGVFGIRDINANFLIEGDTAGGVRLNHDGNKRLETNLDGVEIFNSTGISLCEFNGFGLDLGSKWISAAISIIEDGTATFPGYTFSGDIDTGFFRKADNTIGFATGGVERAFVGNLGWSFSSGIVLNNNSLVGPLDPTGGTHVGDRDYNDSRYSLTTHNHTGVYATAAHAHTGVYLPISGGGTVTGSLGATSTIASGTLTGVGTVYSTAFGVLTNTNPSDRRLKDDIQPLESGLGVVMQLKPSSFIWRANGSLTFGFIAQDVELVEPNLVSEFEMGEETFKGLKSDQIVPILVKAIQDQQAQIDELRALLNV